MIAESSFFMMLFFMTTLLNVGYLMVLARETGSIIIRAYAELYAQVYLEILPIDKKRTRPELILGMTLASVVGLCGFVWVTDLKKEYIFFVHILIMLTVMLTVMYIFFFLCLKKK